MMKVGYTELKEKPNNSTNGDIGWTNMSRETENPKKTTSTVERSEMVRNERRKEPHGCLSNMGRDKIITTAL